MASTILRNVHFFLFFACFSSLFAQSELSEMLRHLDRAEKIELLYRLAAEDSAMFDRQLISLFEALPAGHRRRSIDFILEKKADDGAPLRTEALLSRDTLDFGFVEKGQRMRDTIFIKNIGSGPYSVSRFVSNCGCLAAECPALVVAPGQRAAIFVELDARNTTFGPLVQTISIRDNSAPNQRQLLTIKANVVPVGRGKKRG